MPKKIIAVNGSPRKDKNTAQLLKEALRGAADLGAETKLINLYELKFHGCYSCFACKRLESPTFGKCIHSDDLQAIFKEIHEDTDALIMGAPIYFSHVSADMLAFQERLFFQYYDYSPEAKSLCPRIIKSAGIYTMNATKEQVEKFNVAGAWQAVGAWCKRFLGSYEELVCYDTLQFSDYSKFASSIFDEAHKKAVHETEFPKDLEKAYKLGQSLVK